MVLLGNLAVTAWATGGPLSVSNAEVQPGQTVYVTVSLTEDVRGNTLGLTYDYDTSVMKVIPSQCVWKKKAALQDFSTDSCQGVWASGNEVNLRGAVCVLAFEVLPGMSFTDSEIACELLVKKDAQLVGQYRATGLVSVCCSHHYGNWETATDVLHCRVCTDCGAVESQSHSWGEPVTAPDPENSAVTLQTVRCGVCGGEKVTRTQNHLQEIGPGHAETNRPTQPVPPSEPLETMPVPTVPQQKPTEPPEPTVPTVPTAPTEPTRPTVPEQDENKNQNNGSSNRPDATKPSGYQPKDYNAPEETVSEEGEVHIHADGTVHRITSNTERTEKPIASEKKPAPDEAAASVHEKTQEQTSSETEQEDGGNSTAAVLIIAAGCIMAMAFICWVEKKRL